LFEKIEFLDDEKSCALAKTAEYEKYIDEYEYAICAIGNAKIRLEWIENWKMLDI